jgi:hypothetical protein
MLQRKVAEEINVPNVLPSRRDVEIAGEALGGRPEFIRDRILSTSTEDPGLVSFRPKKPIKIKKSK